MRRLSIAVLLLVLLTACVAAGCGTSGNTTSTAAVTSSSATALTTSSTVSSTASTGPETTAGDTSSTAAAEQPKYGGTARILMQPLIQNACGLPWELWGPQFVFDQFAMDPLFLGNAKGEMVPWLAKSYELAADKMSVTIVLNQGIKFHDGSDLNADVVKWNLDQYMAAGVVVNWKSIEVVDPYTVKIDFSTWTNINLAQLQNGCWIISKDNYDKNGKDYARDHPCGTGPFEFVSYQNNVKMVLKKNPNYWVKGRPYLDGLELDFVADPMTQSAMMQAGEAELIGQQFLNKQAQDLKDKGIIIEANITSTNCLVPDAGNADSPYKDLKVREAVDYAIDRGAVADAFSFGFWKEQNQVPGPDSTIFNPNFTLGRKYDPEKAKQLLAEAGYPDGFQTKLIYPQGMVADDYAAAVQQMLQAVGIKASLVKSMNAAKENEDMSTIHNNLAIQAVDSISGSWNRCFQYTFMSPAAGASNAHWLKSPEWVALADKSLASTTEEVSLAQAVSDQWVKEASVIPVGCGGIGWAHASYVKDAGYFTRGYSAWIKSWEMWLDK